MFGAYLGGIETRGHREDVGARRDGFGAYLGGIETSCHLPSSHAAIPFGAYLGGIETLLHIPLAHGHLLFGAYLGGIETGRPARSRKTRTALFGAYLGGIETSYLRPHIICFFYRLEPT